MKWHTSVHQSRLVPLRYSVTDLPGFSTSWHGGWLSYWSGLQGELLIQVVYDLMRHLNIGQLMHAACHANFREALTPSCRALLRQVLLQACFLLHETFPWSFLTTTEQHAQTQAPSTHRGQASYSGDTDRPSCNRTHRRTEPKHMPRALELDQELDG